MRDKETLMKRITAILFFAGFLAAMTACKTKPDCEYDHTGVLEVTNSDEFDAEVRLDGNLLFNLESGETKDVVVGSGEHTIRCFSGAPDPEEVESVVSIVDCETTSFDISY